jgi:hypothetical protein
VSAEPESIWVVYDPLDDDIPAAYCGALAEELCHEHINEAIADGDIENAEKWIVREFVRSRR